jgi:hypothetical protein
MRAISARHDLPNGRECAQSISRNSRNVPLTDLHTRKRFDKKEPRVVVSIRVADETFIG